MKAVILAGGSGTRLWPLSREEKPKQLHSFVSEKTMLQDTIDRLDFLSINDIYIATTEQYADEVRRQVPQLIKDHLIIEPALRDTAPCICNAALKIAEQNPDEIMAIVYADHLIKNKDEFMRKLKTAEEVAREEDVLAIVEVKAQSPNPNLGYVKIGKVVRELPDGTEIFELDSFVEKPDYETAKKYLFSYKYMWNTGIYVWKISTILKKFKTLAPEVFDAVSNGKYAEAPKISIDYAIMEKVNTKEVRIIPADLGWSDIGNWAALHEEASNGGEENVVHGEHIGIGTKGSVIYGKKGKMIATIGLEDMVIVDTDDALLVCPKSKSSDVRKIVEELKRQNKKDLL
ncbi:MAG: sugar phosphate nucleotidyltransferase [Patescibacteria group bacterium]